MQYSKLLLLINCVGLALLMGTNGHAAEVSEGQKLFEQHCASCHGFQTDGRIPTRFAMTRMNPVAVMAAMTSGSMRVQASMLDAEQKQTLAEALTGKLLSELVMPAAAFCESNSAPVFKESRVYSSGWGGNMQSTGYVDVDTGGVSKANLQELELAWAFAFPGASQARSQPAVLDDVLYFGGAEGSITALDASTGCIYWRKDTAASVRGALTLKRGSAGFVVYAVSSNAEVFALDARTGSEIWRQQVGFHTFHSVTGSPAVHEDKLFIPISSIEVGVARMPNHECCTSSGGVVAVDAESGEILWQMRSTLRPAEKVGTSAGKSVYAPSGAPIWASPTIDAKRNLLYVGTGENYSRPATFTSDAVLALNMDTGEVVWSFQATPDDAWHSGCGLMPDYAPCDDPGPDFDFGMSPILTTLPNGKEALIIGQKSAVVFALNPDSGGEVLWQTRIGKGSALGGIHWGMAVDDKHVYAPNADRLAIIRDVNPDVMPAPGVYALDLVSGEIRWQTPTPGPSCVPDTSLTQEEQRRALRGCITANSSSATVTDGLVFAGDLYGKFRAYDADTGKILWEFDTDREFDARNQIPAKGGSIDGPGPVIANGKVIVNSGYGSFGQRPGNVLLAFRVKS